MINEKWINIRENEWDGIIRYMKNNEYSIVDGGLLDSVEERIAHFFNKKYCVAFCNGTAAIHSASYALFEEGLVTIPKYSYTGAVNAILENSFKIKINDINCNTLLLDKITEDAPSQNYFLTSIWGTSYDFDYLASQKYQHGAKFLFDNSHAYGTTWNSENISNALSVADIACYSMGRGKFIDAGEFGVAVTDSEYYAKKMQELGHINRLRTSHWFSNTNTLKNAIGNKYRPHVMSLLMADTQLNRLEEKIIRNKRTCNLIMNELSNLPHLSFIKNSEPLDCSYWKIPIKLVDVDLPKTKLKMKQVFSEYGIPILESFQYNDYESFNTWTDERYNGQVMIGEKIVCQTYDDWVLLPGYIDIDDQGVEDIRTAFNKILLS